MQDQSYTGGVEAQLGRHARRGRHVVDGLITDFVEVQVDARDSNGGGVRTAGRTFRALQLGLRAPRLGRERVDDHTAGQVDLDALRVAVGADS